MWLIWEVLYEVGEGKRGGKKESCVIRMYASGRKTEGYTVVPWILLNCARKEYMVMDHPFTKVKRKERLVAEHGREGGRWQGAGSVQIRNPKVPPLRIEVCSIIYRITPQQTVYRTGLCCIQYVHSRSISVGRHQGTYIRIGI